MFTEAMIAPCGLDCSLCSRAHGKEDPCPGCNGDDDKKPPFCSEWCGIIQCQKRKDEGYTYCDECPDFPCEHVQERESRYTTQYPLRESPIENLRLIRELGMEAFLEQERQQWTCPSCQGPISVHTGACGSCGRICC